MFSPLYWSVLATIPLAAAHTAFTTLFVNGISQGDGTCVRMNKDASNATFPVKDITSTDVVCGITGLEPVNRTCPLQAGDTVSFQYRAYPDGSQPGVIAYQHSGPCAVYMKQISDTDPASDPFTDTNAAGDGWFKIMYEGYDTATGKWCTNKLNESNEGVISAVIPKDVTSGYYLLRPELLALHAAASEGNPQFYTGCAQVYIGGGAGTATLETTTIPGYVDYDMPAMKFDVWAQPMALPYPEFGPGVYASSDVNSTLAISPPKLQQRAARMGNTIATGSIVDDNASTATAALNKRDTTENPNKFGNCPKETILEVGNWCGTEIPSYNDKSASDTAKCWEASKSCWTQADACWGNFGPAVHNGQNPSTGCYLWNDRCTEIDNSCKAGATSGPPNSGLIRTTKPKTLAQDDVVIGPS